MDIEEARKRARLALSDISEQRPDVSSGSERVPLPRSEFPVPELIYFALTNLLGLNSFGPFEKVRWVVPAQFGEIPFAVALCKFGLEMSVPKGTASTLITELRNRLHRVARIAEGHLQSKVAQQVEAGNITLRNQYSHFDNRYQFFRKKAEEAYTSPEPEPLIRRKTDGSIWSTTYQPWKGMIEGGMYAIAMLDAYFSRLEHLLVLILPFTTYNLEDGNLASFIRCTWDEKLRRLFDFETDENAKLAFDPMKSLKDGLRNPQSHGGFARGNASFYFHVDGVGALPAQLTRRGYSFEEAITPIPYESYKEVCATCDNCDSFLKESTVSKYGIRYAESRLDPSFARSSRDEYQNAMTSIEQFEKFIDRQAHLHDLHANMDY